MSPLNGDTNSTVGARGEVPDGAYNKGRRAPIVAVFLCARCAGYAPLTDESYAGFLSGRCGGCGIHSHELHRFRAWIDTACGCRCSHGHDQIVGDQWAADNVERDQDRAGVGENARPLDAPERPSCTCPAEWADHCPIHGAES